MKIVLDTTTIRADYHFNSPTSRIFLSGLRLIPATLCVPEVVVDEAVNGFRTDLAKAREKEARAQRDLRRILGEQSSGDSPGGFVERKSEEYRKALLGKVANVGGELLPYPKVEHRKLVQRDLQRRRPFRESGVGYRDALIWETVRSLTWGGHERVVFVSGNVRDFGDGPLVHEDLRSDVSNPHRLTLLTSIAAVNREFIIPKMTMLEEARAELENNRAGIFDLTDWLGSQLLDMLQDHHDDLAGVVVGFPQDVGSAWPSEIVELKDLKVLHVRSLSEREVLVRMELRFDVDVSVSWDREDVLNHIEVREWNGDCLESSDASASLNVDLRLGVDLVVDRVAGKVEAEEIGVLEGPCGGFVYGAWDVQNESWEEEQEDAPA
jgi:PIN domain